MMLIKVIYVVVLLILCSISIKKKFKNVSAEQNKDISVIIGNYLSCNHSRRDRLELKLVVHEFSFNSLINELQRAQYCLEFDHFDTVPSSRN